MAASIIESSPAQFERDLRSANKEWKRGKDANVKWSYGATTPQPWLSPSTLDEAEDPTFRPRPVGKPSNVFGSMDRKDHGNINKYARTTGRMQDLGSRRTRHKVSAQEEIEEAAAVSRSVLDYLPGSPLRQSSSNPMDQVLYSFDRADTPGRPLTLGVFVKTKERDTEKFVANEYEVIDTNGDALQGRKARRHLRRGAAGPAGKGADEEVEVVEDGFELL